LANEVVLVTGAARGIGRAVAVKAAEEGAAGMFPYAAAKAGLVGMTRSLALDVAPYDVRVNAVSPGYISTDLLEEFFDTIPGEREKALGVHPLGRIGTPENVAEVVCFLASAAAAFVTGANWAVDGGLGIRYA